MLGGWHGCKKEQQRKNFPYGHSGRTYTILIKTPSCMAVKRTIKAMEGCNIIRAQEPSTTGANAIKWVSQQDNNVFIHVLNYLRVIRHTPLTVPRPTVFMKQIFQSIYFQINLAHQRSRTPLENSKSRVSSLVVVDPSVALSAFWSSSQQF